MASRVIRFGRYPEKDFVHYLGFGVIRGALFCTVHCTTRWVESAVSSFIEARSINLQVRYWVCLVFCFWNKSDQS
jgi:hypothetical protein